MDPHINPASGVWDDNYYASTHPSGGGGGGATTPSFDPAAYDNLLKTLPTASDYVSGVNAKEDSALNDYFGYLNSQETPLSFYTKLSEAQGIPAMRKTQSTLQGQIYDLEDTLRRVEPNITATTGNSLVTEAQRQGMVTAKQKPIIENLGWLGQSLGRVSSAITDATAQALNLTQLQQQGVQQFVDAYKTKLDVAMNQGAQGLQAFMNDTNNVLNVTLAKIHRGEQVSDTEAANAFELLKLQKTAELNMKADAAKTSTEVVEANGRKLLIDKNTGKTIADLGSSTAPKTTPSGFNTTPTSAKPTSSPSSGGINPDLYNLLFGTNLNF